MTGSPHYRETMFDGEQVLLDGATFTDCVIRDGAVIFSHGPAPTFENSRLEGEVRWLLNGTAREFGYLLATLYHHGGQGGRELVQRFFDDVRDGGPWLKPPPREDR